MVNPNLFGFIADRTMSTCKGSGHVSNTLGKERNPLRRYITTARMVKFNISKVIPYTFTYLQKLSYRMGTKGKKRTNFNANRNS